MGLIVPGLITSGAVGGQIDADGGLITSDGTGELSLTRILTILQGGDGYALINFGTASDSEWAQWSIDSGAGQFYLYNGNLGGRVFNFDLLNNSVQIGSANTSLDDGMGGMSPGAFYYFPQSTIVAISQTAINFPNSSNPIADNANTYYSNNNLMSDSSGNLWCAGNVVVSAATGFVVASIQGTNSNTNAAAGNVGEFVSSLVATGSATALTTATPKNVTSISLTAGDWDVEGHVSFKAAAATMTGDEIAGFSSTTATLPTDGSEAYGGVRLTTTTQTNTVGPSRKRFSLSVTTTIYLVAQATFSAGTVSAFGQITARRER